MVDTGETAPAEIAPARPQVVGIGASAGGLESLESLFRGVRPDLGIAYVVVQHLSTTHRSMMVELLSRATSMEVRLATHGARLEPDTVTVIPPGQFLTIEDGHLVLTPKPSPPALTFPIDQFFASLVDEYADESTVVILSGTGSDGTVGARRVREAGGFVIAESPESARFDGMPRAAIDAGVVDAVLTTDEIAEHFARAEGRNDRLAASRRAGTDVMSRISALLARETGVEFGRYKPGTVRRRVTRRAQANGMTDLESYAELLGNDERERQLLFRELLIRVTWFFRDPEMWSAMADLVVRPLVQQASPDEPLRVWVAGCSTGEEAYSLAMLILEEIARQGRQIELKVFATDIDREALDRAAAGVYMTGQVAGIEPERLAMWFIRNDETYRVSPLLRRSVVFAHHNVARDAPFTRVSLLVCRNVLIYLGNELQDRVLSAFHFALRAGGVLVLGASESVGTAGRFQPIDASNRIYRAVGAPIAPTWMGEISVHTPRTAGDLPIPAVVGAFPPRADDALRAVLAQQHRVGVLTDPVGTIVHVYGDVSPHLRMGPGAATLNVLELARPELGGALTASFSRALRTGTTVSSVIDHGGSEWLASVMPVAEVEESTPSGALVVFGPAETDGEAPIGDPEIRMQLDELHAELRRARRSQHLLVEQLETSNEELQAMNEELVASNEELQATNEELQSVNEELYTVNGENARRIDELEVLRHDLDHLLRATDVGALIVDRAGIIRRFTPSVAEFLPVLERDVGRPVQHLASTVGGFEVVDEVRRVLDSGEPSERSVDSQHGPVLVRTLPYRTHDMDGALVTFVDVTTVKRNFEVSRRVLDGLPAHVAFLDRTGTITMVNAAWERFALANGGEIPKTGPGVNYFTACGGDRSPVVLGIKSVLAGENPLFTHVYACPPPDGGERWFLLQCTPVGDEAVVVHFDITVQKHAERMLIGMATHDPLTGVLNRRGIESELEHALARARRNGREVCAVMIDCDDFKRINDQVGHAGGDAVLRTVARRIESTLRSGDVLARIGGDEFLVLLPEAHLAEAHTTAERLRLAVSSQPVAASHDDISLTVSLTVVSIDGAVHTLEHLLDRCRDGLRASKTTGKNRVTDLVPKGPPTARRDEVVGWLQRGALGFATQPIVTTKQGELVGAEILVRSLSGAHHPPLVLFRMAMEEGMLQVIDEHVLDGSLDLVRNLPAIGSWHVNVYPSTLLSMDPARLEAQFGGLSKPAQPLVVELSEQQLLGDPADLLDNIRCLRSLGVKIALDDVGAGRTSLETLLMVEPEVVKIDAALIRGIEANEARRRALARLVQIARSVGAEMVAEGIESYAELRAIDDLGIERCQGFFVGPPVLLDVSSAVADTSNLQAAPAD